MNILDWRKIKGRLGQMGGEELRDRLRQEFYKRQDGLFHKLRFDPAANSVHSSVTRGGRFFFDSDSLDSVLAMLIHRLPAQVDQIILQAEKICRHHFDLLGYEDLDHGPVIDWHADLVHFKRAPKKLFYRVRYLDFNEVGDSKVIWELNRHQHLVTLAKAYRLTGDSRFYEELVWQWRHWVIENPYPMGINWASSLEVAFRTLSWIWIDRMLQGSPVSAEFGDALLHGLAIHGRHMERYLSTFFSPNTHLLGEAVGLFFLGVLYPQIAGAERWQSLGWEIIVRESARQVQGDGFHFEQSTYYHVYALDFFLHAIIIARLNRIPIPNSLEESVEKMLTALCLLGRCGAPPRLGDDDGGRLFDPRRNRSEHLLDPLSTGVVLFRRGDLKQSAGDFREESIWLLGTEGVAQWEAIESVVREMDTTTLPNAGIYLLTAEKIPVQLVMDAGPQGTQSGGHGHSDALSIVLHGRGPLLIDSGTCHYVGDDCERDLFRGTAMHNTLQVDDLDQAEPAGPFSWKRLTQTKVDRWIQGVTFDLLVASHDGYRRLPQPLTHRRWVFSLRKGLYLVRDVVDGAGRHRFNISWHLGPELQLIEHHVFRAKGASHGVAIIPVQGHGWEEVANKRFWSPVYGHKAPLNVLSFGKVREAPVEFATMLIALEEVHPERRLFSKITGGEPNAEPSGYHYVGDCEEYFVFFGLPGRPWRRGNVSSDAEFVCWNARFGNMDGVLILCNGSYVEVEGGPALRCRRPVQWCEVHLEGALRTVRSSDPEAVSQPQ